MFHLRLPGCLPLGDHSLALTLPTALGRHTLNMGEVGLQLALRRQLCPQEEPISQLSIVAQLLRLRTWPVARRIGGEGEQEGGHPVVAAVAAARPTPEGGPSAAR